MNFHISMRTISTAVTAFWVVTFGAAIASNTISASEPQGGVVTIGGSVTEIAFALGQGHRVVARDTTSSYPDDVLNLPDVGYIRALSPEGVLSFGPSLIISEDGAGPPEALDVLEATQVPFITVPDEFSSAGIVSKIKAVGAALHAEGEAEELAATVSKQLQAAEDRAAEHADDPLRVMFILSLQGGRIMASGGNTAADAIIRMSGAENAIEGFDGYKLVTEEAAAAAAPDVILMMDRGGDHSAANDVVFAIPGLSTTPAAQNDRVIRMNGLLMLGFGPRTAEAIDHLTTELYVR